MIISVSDGVRAKPGRSSLGRSPRAASAKRIHSLADTFFTQNKTRQSVREMRTNRRKESGRVPLPRCAFPGRRLRIPSSGRVSSSLILHQASRTESESGRYRVPAVTRSGRTTGRRTVKKTVTGSAETATCRNAVRQYRSPCGVAENAKNRLFRLRWLG